MPNWCSIEMHCDTPEMWSRVVPFLSGVSQEGTEEELTFNNVVPTPQYIYIGDTEGEEDRKRYGAANCWYEWNNAHWGTKWDACEVYMHDSGCGFDTAWCPPYGWLEALAAAVGNLDPGICIDVECDVEGEGWVDYQIAGGELTMIADGDGGHPGWYDDEDEDEE